MDTEHHYVHRVYDTIAKAFDGTRGARWPGVQAFLQSLPPKAWLLDNGCGNGKYLSIRADLTVIGNDRCRPLLECAASRVSQDLTQADGLGLPFRPNLFDAALCIAVFHHVATVSRRHCFLQEIHRVLRPGGRLYITVWGTHLTTRKDWSMDSNGDAWIPWKDSKGATVSLRYYHLFTQEEFLSYFDTGLWDLLAYHEEADNHCVEVSKRI